MLYEVITRFEQNEKRLLLRSAGMAVRANAFGLITVETSAARPLDRSNRVITSYSIHYTKLYEVRAW